LDTKDEKIFPSTFDNKAKHLQDIILNTLPIIYYSCDLSPQLKTTWINNKIEEITGYEPSCFLNEFDFWENKIHPEDKAQTLLDYKNILVNKNTELIYRWKCSDGQYHWFLDKAILVDDKYGNPSEILGVWIDINEKKLAEKELETNRLLTQKILGTVPGILFILDLKNEKIIYSNYSTDEFLGYTTKEIHNLGSSLSKDLLHHDDLKVIKNAIEGLSNSPDGTVIEIELRFKDKEGQFFWFEAKVTLLSRDSENNANQLIGLLQNINDSKLVKDQLKVSESSYRNLFNTIEDAIYIQDQTGSFVDVNNGATKMYGYNREEIIGKTPDFLAAVGKNDLEILNKNLEAAFDGTPQNFEFWGQKKNGEVFLKDVKVYNGIYFGKNVLIAHAQDITKRKQAEEKIQAALAEKNVLLREVHHRVKNNLQAMIYLIEMQIEKLDDQKVQTFLRELQEQARTMSLVYEQLYQSDYLAQVDMDGYLENLATNVIQAFAQGRDINYKVEAENVLLDVETAMPCGLIINELLTNSLKYAFPESFSNLPIINVSLVKESNQIKIIVSDNGIGLPDNFDWENTDSLGLKLVNFWVKYQLAGAIELNVENGTKYFIKFNYVEKQ
jgi:PAS domain S-box-containing protein